MAEAGDHGLEELQAHLEVHHLEQEDTSEELVPTGGTPGDTPGSEATDLARSPLRSDHRSVFWIKC